MAKQLSQHQRHALDVLAQGGHIVYQRGVRGALVSYRLYQKGDGSGSDLAPATFISLREPGEVVAGRKFPEPALIEPFKPRGHQGLGICYRLSAAGRARLASAGK